MAKVIKLILTEEKIGLGKDNDPIRKVKKLWTLDGYEVAYFDTLKDSWFNGHLVD